MLRPKSTISAVTPNGLLGLSILCLITAAILGLLTSYEAQNKAAKAGAQVVQLQKEKAELETKLEANQTEIASLQKRIEEGAAATKPSENPSAGSTPEQQQTEIASLQKRIEEGGAATKPSENPSAGSAAEQQPASLPSLEIKPGTASTPEQPTPAPSPASTPEQSTSAPSFAAPLVQPARTPSPPEIKPDQVEATTPPPRQPKRQKIAAIAAITTPQVAGSPGGTMSISSSRAATYAPKPEYPSEARTRHITGSGVCVVDVDPGSGNVTGASMAESTGDPILDDSAVRTFRKWRFKPGTVSRVRIPVEFR
jgi:protein TonB